MRILSLSQAAREDLAVEVVAIATRLALRDPGQYLNPEETKATVIEKLVRSVTVTARPFRLWDKGDGQEGNNKPHILRILI